jgi:MFS family permease
MLEARADRPPYWALLLPAAAIMMITMGARQSMGLFMSPINTATGMGVVSVSFAFAVGQLLWGATQPVFGAVADRYGSGRVIVLGGLMLAAGTALIPFMSSQWGLVFALGVLAAAGAGAGSFSILIGGIARHLPPEKRSFAGGFVNAGGSFGQFVFAPLMQALIPAFGWINALFSLAALTLATLPLAWPLRRKGAAAAAQAAVTPATAAPAPPSVTLRQQLRAALRDRSYLLLHAGFFTCGVHVAFLMTHLPGEVALCSLPAQVSANALALIGLANIIGSLSAGILGQHYRMKHLLFWFYATRTLIILAYLAAPKTALTFYVFAIGLGFTFLATVPPTAGLVGKLFGTRYLATLFGLTLLSHQIGGFFGAWLGGVTFAATGNYQWMWYADAALALIAALLNLPIREAAVRAQAAPA